MDSFSILADVSRTSLGFFWKAGWAFVLGYFISGTIQAFVPKGRLTQYMGDAGPKSIALSTMFGSASSSCSFAALATARSLLQKGASFVAAVAFMFASTNLVIELGILIFIFLGPAYLGAEIVGGIVLIGISSVLIRLTVKDEWVDAARERVEEMSTAEEDFDWRQRIKSKSGWFRAGHHFVSEWKMVWKEILIGFTIAGVVAVLVPDSFWKTVFLADSDLPAWLVAVENAMLAPFAAAATFIGSMGNIPLATVLAGSGVLFAGIMGFIYSDLIVPPLVAVNKKYYGWKIALYIAVVMYVSIVITALTLNGVFSLLGIRPETSRVLEDVSRFKIDYTFFMNIGAVVLAGVSYWMHRKHLAEMEGGMDHDMEGDGWLKNGAVGVSLLLLAGGVVLWAVG